MSEWGLKKMVCFGEKFVEKKVEGDKIVRISEWRKFDYDFEGVAVEMSDHVDDDPEALFGMGVYLGFDDYHGIDAGIVHDKICELLETPKDDDEDEHQFEFLKRHLPALKEAYDYNITFNSKEKDYA